MTSTEIEQRDPDAGTLEVFPPARAHATSAVAMLHEHAEVYNTAWKLAGQLVQTTMVPKRFFRKQGDATAAILYGAELGLNPIQSLQRVIPIHGMPSLEARTMVGLLKAKGYRVRTTEQSDTSVTVEGISPDGEKYTSTWTIERAKLAGYVPTPAPGVKNPRPDEKDDWVTVSKTWDGKTTTSILGNMKYVTDPQTMLKAKGQAEVCRELAPDVLMGISYSREELESEDQRQFDRFEERGAVPARVQQAKVTVDEIFADEVPIPDQTPADPVEATPEQIAEQVAAGKSAEAAARERIAERTAAETPAGDVTEDQGDGAPDPEPSPAEQPETVPDPVERAEALVAEGNAAVQKVVEAEAKATSKKVAAKRSTAPATNPDKPKSRMRQALEKRLFALLGDAGLTAAEDRDGRLAVYRTILDRPEVDTTDDLDDVAVAKVADQLYAWQQQNALDEQIAGILSDAARDESESAAPAADPTSEGTE
ncbi:hypothetical protein [Mycolicibacterium komossense]|uniref:Uncharacterized protein n=1 Tax=Mycolicibacterium komossense TaxID=1779 RepID=A0ABT3C9K1_9MYCO|nr:hypothetical protein [Mycolicibacterium komossense]MCV7226091.1 hypothetical protein [Mycolicibacterium komossense]